MRARQLDPRQFRRLALDLPKTLDDTRAELAKGALRRARGLSTGRYKSADLRKMGHPYRRGGHPPMHPSVINRQDGRFARSWRTRPGNQGIENQAPHARFLFRGTRRMIRRPILERVAAWVRKTGPAKVADALARAIERHS